MIPRTLRRPLLAVAAWAVGVLAVATVADLTVPPATAHQPTTVYVDARIGDDRFSGRTPEEAVATFEEGLSRATRPGTTVLVMGYGTQIAYAGTETRCVTLVGTKEKPITIRRNIYTNTPNPTVLTATRKVTGWKLVETRNGVRTWAAAWPDRIRLEGDPDDGFVKLGAIGIVGYASRPPADVRVAAWWQDGRLYLRHDHYDPRRFDTFVKNGSGICLSGRSRHVRIEDLSFAGAVHAVRVEPGAVDIRVKHLVRNNVLDKDLRGDRR